MTTRFSVAGFSAMRAYAVALVLGGIAAPGLLADPPARAGRLNYIDGVVSFHPASVDEWAPAEPNRTLTTGDALWTDASSRSEFHVGSTAVRLGAQTEFDIVNLDDQTFQGRLAQGLVTIRIRSVEGGAIYEVDTPNGAVTFGEPGEYRIVVDSSGTHTTLSVWSGSAEVTAAGSSFRVNARQLATVNGTDAPTYDLTDAAAPDDWDAWCLSRDRREDASRSVQYVSREMPGYEDLDEYGHWIYAADYGNVWVPNDEPAGWAPYHTGHWVWVDPWGWTWVDAAPWGYAPYHYGRWAYVQGSWGWLPGPPPPPPGAGVVYARPVYAPALVAFIGGPGWSVSLGVGGATRVGWIPLGPGEAYHPGYAASPTYVRQVNVTNVTNIDNTTNVTNVVNYRNANAPGAVTAVPQSTMANGQPVAQAAVPVSRQQLASAQVANGAAPVVPAHSAVVGGATVRGTGRVSMPPATVMSRAVVARTAPPPAPVPFAQQQRLLATNAGRPLAATQIAQVRQTLPPSAHTTTFATFKPAATTSAGGAAGGAGGLQPAHPGLVPTTPVRGGSVAANGFVRAPVTPTPPVTPTAPVSPSAPGTTGAPPGGAKPQVMAHRVGTPMGGNTGGTTNGTTIGAGGGATAGGPGTTKVPVAANGTPKVAQPPLTTAPKTTVPPPSTGHRVLQPSTQGRGQGKGELKGEGKGDAKGDTKGEPKGTGR